MEAVCYQHERTEKKEVMFWEPCPICGGPLIFLDDIESKWACAGCDFEAPDSDLHFVVENGRVVRVELKNEKRA